MELVRSASERTSAALALNSLICRPADHSSVDLPILGGRSDIALLVPANRHFLFFLAYEASTDQQAACGPAKNAISTCASCSRRPCHPAGPPHPSRDAG